jgi:glucokinase
MSASGRLAIGIDIGGTKMAAGVVDEAGAVLARERAETPGSDPAAVLDTVGRLVEQLRGTHDVVAVGIGAAGLVTADGSAVRFAPHIAWRDEPLRDRVHELVRLPVHVENDANASGWAEYRFGAARDEAQVVMATLGTGIGGAILVDGKLYRGGNGFAGEVGHMLVEADGLPCNCGNRGCWEQYASGRALTRRGRAAAEAGTPLGRRLLDDAGGSVEAIEGQHVTSAARDGNEEALGWLAEVGDWLGVGIASLAAVLDPDVVVVGGGLGEAGDLLLEPARSAFSRTLTGRGHRPEPTIVAAELGADAGMVGAADLARG